MKNYRFYGEEMEVLGQRLDAAREALASAKSEWAKSYWKQNLNQLLFQWKSLPVLHDGDAQMTITPRYTVDYDYYERSQEPVKSYGLTDRFYDSVFGSSADLDWSWENNRAQRLAKAQ